MDTFRFLKALEQIANDKGEEKCKEKIEINDEIQRILSEQECNAWMDKTLSPEEIDSMADNFKTVMLEQVQMMIYMMKNMHVRGMIGGYELAAKKFKLYYNKGYKNGKSDQKISQSLQKGMQKEMEEEEMKEKRKEQDEKKEEKKEKEHDEKERVVTYDSDNEQPIHVEIKFQ